MTTPENRIVNGLWIGTALSNLELLTLRSFTHHGHEFHLWTYNKLVTEIPEGVSIMDANEIIPEAEVFRYKNSNQFGHGKGSVAGFSDVFRYKLLFEKGGWWVDMDVTCLKSFTTEKPYYFRAHHELKVVGNVMKCPKHSQLMKQCYEIAKASVNDENQDWHLPIQILNDQIKRFNLEEYIVSDESPPDQWHIVCRWLFTTKQLPKSYVFIHWLHEVWRTKDVTSLGFLSTSAYGRLLVQHNLFTDDSSQLDKLLARIGFLFLFLLKSRF